ncbi:MAG: NUDIX hydrolase [Erysipelotrichaceae bacterium]|nr:NUDIX hydrolase [Erysipelotrichaceae bacterium]
MNRLIKEHEIYKGRICRFTHNEVEFADGSTGWRDILHLPGAVAVLAVDENNRILFVEQFRHAVNDSVLELPAGMLEKGEDPEEAALRELQEETGYHADRIQLLAEFYTSPGVVNEKIYLYGAGDLTYVHQDLDDDEFLEVKRLTFAEVEDMIEKKQLKDGKSILGFELYRHFMKKD